MKEERDGERAADVCRKRVSIRLQHGMWEESGKWKDLLAADLKLVLGTFNSFSLLDRKVGEG